MFCFTYVATREGEGCDTARMWYTGVEFNTPPLVATRAREQRISLPPSHYRFPRLIMCLWWVPKGIGGFCCLSCLGRSHKGLQGRSRGPNPVGFRREESYIGIMTDKLASFVAF